MSGDVWAVGLVAGMCGLVVGAVLALIRRPRADADQVARQLEVHAAELRRIADQASQRDLTSEQLRAGLEGARRALDELRVREQERRATDTEQLEVVRRLATVLAGGTSKGRSGEHILREHLSELPPGMLVTDFRVNGKVVEFGLTLPDGRCLPIDSKWTAVAELEALEASADAVERDERARAVEKAVVGRVKEVAQYLDPNVTAPVAVAAVPDAAYAVLKRTHAEAYAKGVVLVPYSTSLPVVLFLFSLVKRYGDASDAQATIAEVAGVLEALDSVLENRFARAATMLTNGADEMRSQLGKARGSIARANGISVEAAADGDEESPSLQVIG